MVEIVLVVLVVVLVVVVDDWLGISAGILCSWFGVG